MSNATQQLIYLIYGTERAYHEEARFSIASALFCQRREQKDPKENETFNIRVYTDQPEHYQDLPVVIETLGADQLQQFYGPHQYNHRSKLCVMQDAVTRADKTVFIDTDTFFLRSPQHLFDAVTEQQCIADEVEPARLSDMGPYNHPDIQAALKQRQLDPENIVVINSGIFGIHSSHANVLQQALELADTVYPASGREFATEQLVLGIVAKHVANVVADDKVLKHYWSRKNIFRAKIRHFLDKFDSDLLSEVAYDDFANVTPALPRPPRFSRLWIKCRTALVPAYKQFFTELLYGCFRYSNEYDRSCKHAWWLKARENFLDRRQDAPSTESIARLFKQPLNQWILGNRNCSEISDFYQQSFS